jgi:hypothetical protein
MKNTKHTTTSESRETIFFSNFENNIRKRWSAHRRFGY